MKAAPPRPAQAETFSPAYLRYALAILFLTNALNVADRSIVGVLLEAIRKDMDLSDTQIGVLTGFAFALFYAIAGIFIARLSDLYDRRIVLGASVLIWSGMTALTGAASTFGQLFLARMGVGVGESSAVPTSHAMIADYFPPAQRPLALSIFIAGAFVGVLGGSALGGYVGQAYGWRWAFVVAAAPGIPLAILILLTLRDPARGSSDGVAAAAKLQSLPITLKALLNNAPFLLLILSCGFITFMALGLIGWLPTFLMRVHHLDQGRVGLFFGTAVGIGTVVGTVLGGVIANRLARRSLRWLTRLPFMLSFLLPPLYEIAIMVPRAEFSLLFIGLATMVGSAMFGPVLAAIQTVLPPAMRATGSSLTGFCGSLIGLGAAPLIVGMLSDHFTAELGAAEALRRAIAISVGAGFVLSLLLFLADRALVRWRNDHASNP